jgi:hypothetical protein
VRLEEPPGLSPITTVGRFDTVEAAQVATDEGVGGEVTHADRQIWRGWAASLIESSLSQALVPRVRGRG